MKQTITKLGGALFVLLFLVTSSANATITATWDWSGNQPDGINAATNYGINKEVNIASTQSGVDLYVNTGTTGKFSTNGGLSYVQMVSGTIVRIPVVSTKDVVSINFAGNSGFCTINGSTASLPHTATQAEVTQGYVEIGVEGTDNSIYINSISVELAYLPPVKQATWDFTNSSATALAVLALSGTSTDQAITVNGIDMIVNANGKTMGNNTNSIWTYPGVSFRVPVFSAEDIITVNGYHGYCEYTINGGETITEATTNYACTTADLTRGYVEIINGVTNYKYICSISLVKGKYQATATIGSTGWATFSNASGTDFTNLAGVVDAYQVTGNSGSAITKEAITTAAANTGLLLNAAAGTYAIPLTTTGTDLSTTNKLVAVASSTPVGAAAAGYTNFVLVGGSGTACFKQITGDNKATVSAGKAYLQLAGDSFAPQLFFDGDVTGISEIEKMRDGENEKFFDLMGRKVAQPAKGLYIVNGKKVVIK